MPGGIGLQRLRRVCMKVTAYESLSSHSTRHLKRFSSKMLKSRGILHRPRRGISQRASTSVWPVVRCFSFFLASALCRRKTRKKKKEKKRKEKGETAEEQPGRRSSARCRYYLVPQEKEKEKEKEEKRKEEEEEKRKRKGSFPARQSRGELRITRRDT